MKKILSIVLVLVLALAMFAACDGGGSSSQDTSTDDGTTSPAATGETTKVIIWDYFETEAQKTMMDKLITDFNASQDQYEAEHKYIPFESFKNQLTVGLQSGDLPDLVIIDSPDMASYISLGLFVDITDMIGDIDSSAYFEGAWASTMLDGKNYGLPFATNCTSLFYNKTIFDDAGVEYPTNDWTWDDFKEAAIALTDTSKNISGFGFAATATEEGTFQTLPWLYMTGASYDNVGGAEGIRTYEYLQELAAAGAIANESINWTQSDVNNQFMAGTLAMQQNGPWQLPGIASGAPDLDYGVALMPKDVTSSSALGGENLGVVKGNNTEGAIEFLKFYDQTEVMTEAMQTYGSFPPRTEAAQDAFWTADPIQAVFIEQLETAVPRGPSPEWPQISEVLIQSMQKALMGSDTPENIAATAQAGLDEILNAE